MSATLNEIEFNHLLLPVPAEAKLFDEDYIIWGATPVRGDDGRYHLFYSRWPVELGHNAWVTHSEIAHAVAEAAAGPYVHQDVALPARGAEYWDGLCTHCPNVHKFDGKYYLYYLGNTGDGVAMKGLNWTHRNNQRVGVAVADSPDGPWTRFDEPLIDVGGKGSWDELMTATPAVCRKPDGGYLLIYKLRGDAEGVALRRPGQPYGSQRRIAARTLHQAPPAGPHRGGSVRLCARRSLHLGRWRHLLGAAQGLQGNLFRGKGQYLDPFYLR